MARQRGDGEEEEDELGETGVEDMIQLRDLTEESMLRNIRLRYRMNNIYTYTGSILVAVNPYKMFSIYGLDVVKKYENNAIGTLPPHLFATGSAAYDRMVRERGNQVIVISGESGAGKTESFKLLMQYLAAVNRSSSNMITEQILEASPLLESFGNAKTIRNDNSSRFGKYVEVYFKGGGIVGARTSEYLLEKSRIVTQTADERNYHVFYELLAGLTEEQRARYGLLPAASYLYLNQGGNCFIAGRDDRKRYKDLQAAMEVLEFNSSEQETIIKILSAVLHLGNVYFQRNQVDDSVQIGEDAELDWVTFLLDLDKQWLSEALTMKVTEARRERVLSPLLIDQALDSRDAIAKALYERLFSWLVERINKIVWGGEKDERTTSIAMLDIFGFEDFAVNSFEQLCINYANETLQFYFNKHVFKLEQVEYAKENIDWTVIKYHDNQTTIDLIAKKPQGLLHILDDESNFPKATDTSFLEKCHMVYEGNRLYVKPRLSAPEFSIIHYAGKVTYNVRYFLDKNRDMLRNDVMELLIQSKNEVISHMFLELRESTLSRTVSKVTGMFVTMKHKVSTVSSGFHASLENLLNTMARCHPWFVRCIKPNNFKLPMTFEMDVVLTQLRYTGMLETIRIRKMGYPIRLTFAMFSQRYHVLTHLKKNRLVKRIPNGGYQYRSNNSSPAEVIQDEKQHCRAILSNLSPGWNTSWQIGLTKVFLREHLAIHLDKTKVELTEQSVIKIQRFVRCFLQRRRFLRIREANVVLQAAFRGYLQRERFLKMRAGFIKTQAKVRMLQQRRVYEEMKSHVKQEQQYLERQRQAAGGHYEEEAIVRLQVPDYRPDSNIDYDYTDSEIRVKPSPLTRARIARFEKQRTVKRASTRQEMAEEEERQARAVTRVTNLEIPADLAYTLSSTDSWNPPHHDRQIVPAVQGDNVVAQDMKFDLPADINAYAFTKYVNVYFKQKWHMRKNPVSKPFLAKNNELESQESLALFRLILRFMNDPALLGKREKIIADYIVQRGISYPKLRDEIYAQICNQTLLNKNDANNERGWLLMSQCLSCFPPSSTLAKYLLKYVSDNAYNGYKWFCQQKLLQCYELDPELGRYYPPSMLEWKAARKRAGMAVEVRLPDGSASVGHVDSWTSSEEFVAYLLQRTRNINDGQYGWTVTLVDEGDRYEVNGSDYLLDLISEMEVPPAFPYIQAPFLVSTDFPREANPQFDTPHTADQPRYVDMQVNELRSPIPATPRPMPTPGDIYTYDDVNDVARNEDDAGVGDLSPSILNVRYTGKPPTSPTSPAPPHDRPAPVGGNMKLAPSPMNDRYWDDAPVLSPSNLNKRYQPNGSADPNGLPNGNLSPTNRSPPQETYYNNYNNARNNDNMPKETRYIRNPQPQMNGNVPGRNARGQLYRQNQDYPDDQSMISITSHTDPRQVDRWLDKVFDGVFHGVDDLSDARSLKNHMKGGGQGIPGMPGGAAGSEAGQTVGNSSEYMGTGIPGMGASMAPNFGLTAGAPFQQPFGMGPMSPPSMNTGFGFGTMPMQPMVDPMATAMAQQVAQQQAMMQSQQAQSALQQQQLQLQLQKTQLENQILQQSLQGEYLKQQLRQIQDVETQQSNVARQIAAAQNPNNAHAPPPVNRYAQPASAQYVPPTPTTPAPHAGGMVDTSRPGGVTTLKKSWEVRSPQPLKSPPPIPIPTTPTERKEPPKVTFASTSSEPESPPPPPTPSTPAPPPTPPASSAPTANGAPPPPPAPPGAPPAPPPPPGGAPPAPPPPPGAPPAPPPPPGVPGAASTNTGNQTPSGSLRGPDGKIQVKRIGKIQWPPPRDEVKKGTVKIGKLDIDEKRNTMGAKRATHIDELNALFGAKRVQQEPVEPPKQDGHVPIDMAKRRQMLGQNLSKAGIIQGGNDSQVPPPPPPVKREPVPAMPLPPMKDDDEVPMYELQALERARTILHDPKYNAFFTYNRVPWILEIRKEVFGPQEKIDNAAMVNLIFCQIVQDVFAPTCIRISKEDVHRMRSLLGTHGVTPRNALDNHKAQVKKLVIDTARDWPYYFARLYPVNGGSKMRHIHTLAVSHSGVRLLSRDKDLIDDQFKVHHHYRFEDIIDVSVPQEKTLQLHIKDNYIMVYSPKASQIKRFIDSYCIEAEKSSIYVRAIKNYVTREKTLLSFQEGDIIKLTRHDMPLDKGWMYGALHGQTGMFPSEYVTQLARNEIEHLQGGGVKYVPKNRTPPVPKPKPPGGRLSRQSMTPQPSTSVANALGHRYASMTPGVSLDHEPEYDRSPSVSGSENSDALYNMPPDTGKLSMLEFAMMYFRESPFRYELKRNDKTGSIHGTFKLISSIKARSMQKEHNKKRGVSDWTWKEQADMVKWTKSPIQASLLKFESPSMNRLSVECFFCLMRFMGDYPLENNQQQMDCVYTILKACYSYNEIRDEVYCQVIKQVTNNRSVKQDSTQQGWRLLTLITSYFDCSDILKPYLFNFLEQNAYDQQRQHQSLAAQCLTNLRTTFRYGGRKNVPSKVEVEAVTRGRNTKRQMCVLPGGSNVVLNIRSCSVVQDAIDQICGRLDVGDAVEREEFSIFYVIESEDRYCPLQSEDYIFDITSELTNQKKQFYLLFQRSSWVFNIHLDGNAHYIDVMYYAVIMDYHDGFFLPMPRPNHLPEYVKDELVKLAAFQIKASDEQKMPSIKDVMAKLPRNAHQLSEMSPQKWSNEVQAQLSKLGRLSPHQAKCAFLETLSRWPLFGSTFFSIKSVADPRVKGNSLLAINKAGVHFLHPKSHETLITFPMSDIISTRRFQADNNVTYLDIKCGNLMTHSVTRIETNQGMEISGLIGQYIKINNHIKNPGSPGQKY